MRLHTAITSCALAGALAFSLGACASSMDGAAAGESPAVDLSQMQRDFPMEGQPGIPYSGVAPDEANQAVLTALMQMSLRPYHTLTPDEARNQPTFADGVMAVMRARGGETGPSDNIIERRIALNTPSGQLPARVFAPTPATPNAPMIVYFHGGGWVLADSEDYAGSARGLVRNTGAIVLSVDYRRAPENKFPAQHEDALAAYRWALENADALSGDARRVALAGESAGGNLAIATAMAARDAGLPQPVHILSIYPVADTDLYTPSYQENANALPLNRAAMGWFFHHTVRSPQDLMDPRLRLVAADLRGLAPVTLVLAQVDPLRSEGELLAQRLQAQGVPVEMRTWAGATHEFFGGAPLIEDASEAQAWAGERLTAAFANPPARPAQAARRP
jgi:acetyl esterase/lipase